LPAGKNNNLIPHNERSKEEARKNGRKGGIASGKARHQKSTAKDVIKMVLNGNIPPDMEDARNTIEGMGLPETEMNMQAALIAGQALSAAKGNQKAAEWLYGMIGESSDTAGGEQKQIYQGLPARVLGKAYVDINRDIDARKHSYYDFRGGRGSLKSSYCGLKLIDLMMLNNDFCALAARQVKDTIKDSVYAQIVWAIDELGLSDEFHCTKSPMEIRRKSTGQIIYFRGADDPMKIKSIKPPNGMYIGVLWIEEADQIHSTAAYRNILQSVMRGGDNIIVFRSYNTPISNKHYINVDARENNPARIIHHSYFTDAPKEWLKNDFHELAERTKEINPRAYEHEYLGVATGTGLNVFENVKERTITDDELKIFDRLYFGLDWGQFPHPNAFVAIYFNPNTRQLYIYDEICRYKTRDEDMAVLLDKYRNVTITADPGGGGDKSIRDFQAWGFRMYAAIKGPGSIEAGIKWLQGLTEIVIDKARCPNAAEQFLTYEYLRDKEDNPITGYPDEGDDFIDATRYAMESVWRRRGQ